ncbi:MAG: tyrosine-type recombinase/integrase [Alphaproteobacteria bacterium]|nr:tyrosine-type recombinase/integrase [Alphaproteobacteria bacterium]
MARVRLSKAIVDELETPSEGQVFTWDAEVKGFAVRVTSKGAKSWIVQMKVRGGKERRMTVGLCSKLPLDRARVEARKLLAHADLGRDVGKERKDARRIMPEANPTMADFAERWLDEVVERRNRPGTVKLRRLLVKNHITPHIGTKRLTELTRKDIEDLHHEVTKQYPVAANRAVSTLSAILATAMRWGLLASNPALNVDRNAEEGRERYLTPEEIKGLAKALDESPAQDSADVVRLLLLTGARVGEVLAMRWEQLNLEVGVWTKPAATTKQNKTHRVPLSPPAVLVLTKRQQAARKKADERLRRNTLDRRPEKGNPWVFPGEGKDGHMTAIRCFWEAVCKRSGIKGARVHDLRHTFASLLVSSGESLPVVGALLGHTQAKTTSRYAHLLDDPLRAATNRVAEIAESGKL